MSTARDRDGVIELVPVSSRRILMDDQSRARGADSRMIRAGRRSRCLARSWPKTTRRCKVDVEFEWTMTRCPRIELEAALDESGALRQDLDETSSGRVSSMSWRMKSNSVARPPESNLDLLKPIFHQEVDMRRLRSGPSAPPAAWLPRAVSTLHQIARHSMTRDGHCGQADGWGRKVGICGGLLVMAQDSGERGRRALSGGPPRVSLATGAKSQPISRSSSEQPGKQAALMAAGMVQTHGEDREYGRTPDTPQSAGDKSRPLIRSWSASKKASPWWGGRHAVFAQGGPVHAQARSRSKVASALSPTRHAHGSPRVPHCQASVAAMIPPIAGLLRDLVRSRYRPRT